MKTSLFLFTFLWLLQLCACGSSSNGHSNATSSHATKTNGQHGIYLATWRWDEYSDYFAICVMIIMAAIVKVIFHEIPFFSTHFPESCMLIMLGIFVGFVVYIGVESHSHHFPEFTSGLFFNVLLPPIILDSAYSLYDRDFLNNLMAIVQFAVVGTIFNVFAVGYILYALYASGVMGVFQHELTLIQCLIFSSLISAVDPVAVLAIFDEVGVNKSLYFLVFGESLFNDGVTVVLYNTMVALSHMGASATSHDYFLAFASFFFVVFGGLFIGLFVGALSAFMCRFTQHIRVVEPLVVFTTAFFSFIFAETLHWSGIISLIGCGIAQKRYAFPNISSKSLTTVQCGLKTMSALSDVIIFLFLGIVTISKKHEYHYEFSFWTVIVCILVRFLGIYLLSARINKRRIKAISKREQFIMAYGGLRGGVGFSLVTILEDENPFKVIFQTTTLLMIFFTVFILGSTVKPLVDILNIQKEDAEEKGTKAMISKDVNEKLIDHIMAGMESVVGRKMSRYQMWNSITNWDEAYFKKFLIRANAEDPLTLKLQKISIAEHYARLYGPTMMVKQNKVHDMLVVEEIEERPIMPAKVAALRENSCEDQQQQPSRKSSSRKLSKYIRGASLNASAETEPVDLERQALTQAFSGNSFNRFTCHHFDQDSDENVKLELEKMVENRTKLLWNIALEATQNDEETDNKGEMEIQAKIRQAYEKSKLDK